MEDGVHASSSIFHPPSYIAVHFHRVPFHMMRRLRALSLFALVAPVFALSAQQPPKPAAAAAATPPVDPCPIDLMQPAGLAIANLQRPKLANVKTIDDANKVMKDVSKMLFDDKQKANVMGRDLLLAEFVTFYIQYADSAKRGDIGFPEATRRPVRRPAEGLWTRFSRLVENAEPKCKETALSWRGYTPYATRIKAAYAAVSAGAADTAKKRSSRTRALIINHSGPQPYDVLWRVAKIRKDEAKKKSCSCRWQADKLEGDKPLNSVGALELSLHARAHSAGNRRDEDGQSREGKTLQGRGESVYAGAEGDPPDERRSTVRHAGDFRISAAVTSDTSISKCGGPDHQGDARKVYRSGRSGRPACCCRRRRAIRRQTRSSSFRSGREGEPVLPRLPVQPCGDVVPESKRAPEMIPIVHNLIQLDPAASNSRMTSCCSRTRSPKLEQHDQRSGGEEVGRSTRCSIGARWLRRCRSAWALRISSARRTARGWLAMSRITRRRRRITASTSSSSERTARCCRSRRRR